jgi:hypothetical protein
MRELAFMACTLGQAVLLASAIYFFPVNSASAKECANPPKTARGKCLKAAYNYCNKEKGLWEYPPGRSDPCPK